MKETLLIIWEAVKEFLFDALMAFGKFVYTVVDVTVGWDFALPWCVIGIILCSLIVLMWNRIEKTTGIEG